MMVEEVGRLVESTASLLGSATESLKQATSRNSLPRGWLQTAWVVEACTVTMETGDRLYVDNVVEGASLFLWIRKSFFPSLTVSQYRTAVKRMVEPPGPGYASRSDELPATLTQILREAINKLGKKPWACNVAMEAIRKGGKKKKKTEKEDEADWLFESIAGEFDLGASSMWQGEDEALFQEANDSLGNNLLIPLTGEDHQTTPASNLPQTRRASIDSTLGKRTSVDNLLIPLSEEAPSEKRARRECPENSSAGVELEGDLQGRMERFTKQKKSVNVSPNWNPFSWVSQRIFASRVLPSFILSGSITYTESDEYLNQILDTVYYNYREEMNMPGNKTFDERLLPQVKELEAALRAEVNPTGTFMFSLMRGRTMFLYWNEDSVKEFGADRTKVSWNLMPRAEIIAVLQALFYRALGYKSYGMFTFHGNADGYGTVEMKGILLQHFDRSVPTKPYHLFFKFEPTLNCFVLYGKPM